LFRVVKEKKKRIYFHPVLWLNAYEKRGTGGRLKKKEEEDALAHG